MHKSWSAQDGGSHVSVACISIRSDPAGCLFVGVCHCCVVQVVQVAQVLLPLCLVSAE